MPTSGMPWVKIWAELLDDGKFIDLPRRCLWRFIELIVIAGECDAEGLLVSGKKPLTVKYLSWRLRTTDAEIGEDLQHLIDIDVIEWQDDTLFIPNFSERQGRPQSVKREQSRQRQTRYRENNPKVTPTVISPVSNALPNALSNASRVEKRREEERREEKTSGETPAATHSVVDFVPPENPAPAKRTNGHKPAEHKQSENYRPIYGWLQTFIHLNIAAARLGKVAKQLDDDGATIQECKRFEAWWNQVNWKGAEKHEKPNGPEEVWQQWPRMKEWDGVSCKNEPAGAQAIREAMADPRWNESEEKHNGKL